MPAGEEFRPGDDHEDESHREGETGQQTQNAIRQIAAAGGHRCREDGAHGNERAGEYRERERRRRVEAGFRHADLLRFPRHLERRERVEADRRQLLGRGHPPHLQRVASSSSARIA